MGWISGVLMPICWAEARARRRERERREEVDMAGGGWVVSELSDDGFRGMMGRYIYRWRSQSSTRNLHSRPVDDGTRLRERKSTLSRLN